MKLNSRVLSSREEEVAPNDQVDGVKTKQWPEWSCLHMRVNMSVDGTRLLFEGFLQKRKDTLKIRWVTYWFRLQNTTLFFYTKKNGSASHLRGYYYIYRVQSVREIQRTDRKPFLFEIIMTNGKRKMLAAETEALRTAWVGHLWQAMQLSSSGLLDARVSELEDYDQRDRLNSDSVIEVTPARPLSTFSSSEHIYSEAGGVTSPTYPPEEQDSDEATYQNVQRPFKSRTPDDSLVAHPQLSSELSCKTNKQENLYDVLPSRKNPLFETHDVIYDFPQSYKPSTRPQDSIYDVPSCVLRKNCDRTEDEQNSEETYWKI